MKCSFQLKADSFTQYPHFLKIKPNHAIEAKAIFLVLLVSIMVSSSYGGVRRQCLGFSYKIDCRSKLVFISQKLPNIAKLANTVSQKITTNDVFWVLCRKRSCAITAPGQPPTRDKKCSVFSGVRHFPDMAADLSLA